MMNLTFYSAVAEVSNSTLVADVLSGNSPLLPHSDVYHNVIGGKDDLSIKTNTSTSDNVTEATWDKILIDTLGPKRLDLYKCIPITIIYCFIFMLGIIGNVSTCIVVARNRYMQTATNFYLFNLAVSDLLVLVLGLPQETYTFWSQYPWIFGEPFCIIRIMASETSTYASILTITAFTVERYIAICHSMRAQTMSSLRRAIKVIIIIWVVSALCSIPMVVQFGVVYLRDATGNKIPQSAICSIEPERFLKHAFEMSTFLFFLAPMTIITVLYVLIGLAIRRSTLSRAGSDSSNYSGYTGTDLRAQQQARARRAVLKMLGAVVVAFFLCWAPFHAQRLMGIYLIGPGSAALQTMQNVLFYISGVLYYVSSVINPILYNIMSLKFRQAFGNTIFRMCRRRRKKSSSSVNNKVRYKTYRFNQRPLWTDTNLTLLQLHLNGYKAGDLRKYRQYLAPKYAAGKSNSSSVSGGAGCSSPRVAGPVVQMGEDGPLQDQIEMGQVVGDFKSYHSGQRPTSVHYSTRPYHSYA